MRIIRAAECRPMPWKNGGGETVEIAVEPVGAGLDDFKWRLSSATVAVDGPFSVFPDVDRSLALLEGAGLDLQIAGSLHQLRPGDAPLAFPGDVPASARLVGGPISDLNMMTRRGSIRHAMRRIRVDGAILLRRDAATTLVFCAGGAVRIGGSTLGSHDAAILRPDPEPLRLDGAAVLYGVTIEGA